MNKYNLSNEKYTRVLNALMGVDFGRAALACNGSKMRGGYAHAIKHSQRSLGLTDEELASILPELKEMDRRYYGENI